MTATSIAAQPVPLELLERQVRDLKVGESCWIAPSEISVSDDGFAFAYNSTEVRGHCKQTHNLRLTRNEDGSFTAGWGPHARYAFARSTTYAQTFRETAERYTPITAWE